MILFFDAHVQGDSPGHTDPINQTIERLANQTAKVRERLGENQYKELLDQSRADKSLHQMFEDPEDSLYSDKDLGDPTSHERQPTPQVIAFSLDEPSVSQNSDPAPTSIPSMTSTPGLKLGLRSSDADGRQASLTDAFGVA